MTLLVEMIGYFVGEGETLISLRPYLLLRSTLCAFRSHYISVVNPRDFAKLFQTRKIDKALL